MKHLVVHGDWVVKDALYHNLGIKNQDLNSPDTEWFGGVHGFIVNIANAIDQIKPDRVIVMWDGILYGNKKYDKHPIIKNSRMKNWNLNMEIISNSIDETDKKKLQEKELFHQKIFLKQLIEDLFLRQLEFDDIEASDMILEYKNISIKNGDSVCVYAKPKSFQSIIGNNCSLYVRGKGEITQGNSFKEEFGYDHRNSHLMHCIIGDEQRNVSGVEGVGFKTILKYFPQFAEDKLTFGDVMSLANEKMISHPLKVYEKILSSYERMLENFRVLNENFIYLTNEVRRDVEVNFFSPLSVKDRDIESVLSKVRKHERNDFFEEFKRSIVSYYFLMNKEIYYIELLEKIDL